MGRKHDDLIKIICYLNFSRCHCPANFYGTHCLSKRNDCSSSSSRDLCGNGYCINTNDNGNNYKCICDAGWKSSEVSPACNVDIDECSSTQPHCSKSPAVACINTLGSYTCGPCPAGYTGNGYYCADINECELNNGGCSVAPTVACINTMGSFRCGSCPSGFQGDGRVCIPSATGACPSPLCHNLATCTPSPLGVSCSCPPGFVGNGYGPNGCSAVPNIKCASNPCLNGANCTDTSDSYTCRCLNGFTGRNCEQYNPNARPCVPNPCQNGGTCSVTQNTYLCTCQSGFGGLNCESEIRNCGGVRTALQGSIKFPPDGYVSLPGRKQCVWFIRINETKVINATFERFEMDETQECTRDFLQIHDGKTTAAPLIGRYCGRTLPKGGNIVSTHDSLYIWFRLDSQSNNKGFTLNWTAVDPGLD